jgi:hypothetical protein
LPTFVGCRPPPPYCLLLDSLHPPPPHHPPLPSFEAVSALGWYGRVEQLYQWEPAQPQADRHAICSRQDSANYLPVTTRLLELYQEHVDNGGWARVLYEARGRIDKLTLSQNSSSCGHPSFTSPAWTMTGKQEEASMRQEVQGGLGREEEYSICSQALPLSTTGEEETAVAALTITVVDVAAAPAHTMNASPKPSQCLHLQCLWKRAKTVTEAIRASSW